MCGERTLCQNKKMLDHLADRFLRLGGILKSRQIIVRLVINDEVLELLMVNDAVLDKRLPKQQEIRLLLT